LIAPLGFVGGKMIVDDYLLEVRPLFLKPRTFHRTVYRPGTFVSSICGTPASRRRSGTVRPDRDMSSWPRWGTPAPAPARWCSAVKRLMCNRMPNRAAGPH